MQRQIFKYFNGQREVFADPLEVNRRILKESEGVDFEATLKKFDGPDFLREIARADDDGTCYDADGNVITQATHEAIRLADERRREAVDEMLPVLRAAFRMPELDEDGNGATIVEVLDAFNEYNIFQINVKKNTETTPNSPPSTDARPLPTTTNGGSATGTTETARSRYTP